MASWVERGKNTYKLTAELGYDAKGKRMRDTTTITLDHKPRKGELDLAAAKFEEDVKGGKWQKPGVIGFEEFVYGDWKKNYADINLGDYTRKNYMALIKTHLIPAFGRFHLDKINTMQIVSFFTSLRSPDARKDKRNKPLATNTLLNIYKALKAILDAAHDWNLIVNNPMVGVKRPTAPKSEQREIKMRKKSYSPTEATGVITALYSEPKQWKLYYLGVLLGGFRRGEYLAVEWSEVDFVNGGVYIEKQITFDEEGKSVEGEVKTVESEGFVPMPRWYMDELLTYKREWMKHKMGCDPQDWKGGNKQYLFHPGHGDKYYPNTPSRRWRMFLDDHKLPRVRLHDLRHTTAMLLRAYGADLKAIQEQLRHSRLATTTDIYMTKDGVISRGNIDLLDDLDPKKRRGHQLVTEGDF
ncbi:tyrosine-type recombinase/integrase [Paenibacillus sp. FSL K6-2524]|uniref:tyrosine-type recombinase/integrase n=1 Tax=Paenibacillus sp. FSL K6-2524 TaxID=2954516 RepID=UPI0030FA587A